MSGGLFHPPVLAPRSPPRPLTLVVISSRSRPSRRRVYIYITSLSLHLDVCLAVSSLYKCLSSTVVDVPVETEDPTTPPANHAAVISPRPSEKQSESRLRCNHHASCRRRLFPLVPQRVRFFDPIFRFKNLHSISETRRPVSSSLQTSFLVL